MAREGANATESRPTDLVLTHSEHTECDHVSNVVVKRSPAAEISEVSESSIHPKCERYQEDTRCGPGNSPFECAAARRQLCASSLLTSILVSRRWRFVR